ncbi:hypothetical protein ABZ383_30465 [Streptomyces sp. NPDC005900]|uniref:hypothetical protein n=1 Tax=Streptomyces sp. NPDC005900 TaxID=3154569 RepID=UPI0033D6AD2B
MTTPPPAPYQPTSDDDARLHLAQIIGSNLDTPVWTGDWHETLRDTAARYSSPPATEQQPPTAAAA